VGLTAVSAWLTRWLALPSTAACDLDDPQTTALRREIIQAKPFLQQIYTDWYREIAAALPAGDAPVLELGAGAGFMRRCIPHTIASDILRVPAIDLVADASHLPFVTGSLRGVAMTNVLHHLPDVRAFLNEAARCVQPGGAMVMIEPWVTPWSSIVYRRFHSEPFEPGATDWSLPPGGPLSGANGALPWILFQRDRNRFEQEFPVWRIARIQPQMPFRYLVSGGVSLRALSPAVTYSTWRLVEHALSRWMSWLGMFATIVLVRSRDRQAPA
jgi:SAM-dependent methyltransferase